MRRRFLRTILVVLATITIICFNNASFAVNMANICNLDLIPNKSQVQPGETIVYEVKITDIKDADGIVTFGAYINYDDDVLTFDDNNVAGDQWSCVYKEENDITLNRTSALPSKEDQVVARLSFTVKSNANVRNQTIKLENIMISTENETYDTLPDVSATFSIVQGGSSQNSIPENQVPENEIPTNEIPVNEIPENEIPENEILENEIDENLIDENIIKDNEVEDKNQISQENLIDDGKNEDATRSKDRVLPQTGTAEIVGAIALVLLIISAVIFHKKYNKWYGI